MSLFLLSFVLYQSLPFSNGNDQTGNSEYCRPSQQFCLSSISCVVNLLIDKLDGISFLTSLNSRSTLLDQFLKVRIIDETF
jgi:hypothetical protein